jgi:L1 cell adhesion molecule like protein
MFKKIIPQLLTHNILSADAKRLIGRRFTDASVQSDISSVRSWLFQGLVTNPWLLFSTRVRRSSFAVEEISSIVLIKMRGIAKAYIG